jgi:hypothetical protein
MTYVRSFPLLFDGKQRHCMGFIDDCAIYTGSPGSSRTLTLAPLQQKLTASSGCDDGRVTIIRMPRDNSIGGGEYFIEYRGVPTNGGTAGQDFTTLGNSISTDYAAGTNYEEYLSRGINSNTVRDATNRVQVCFIVWLALFCIHAVVDAGITIATTTTTTSPRPLLLSLRLSVLLSSYVLLRTIPATTYSKVSLAITFPRRSSTPLEGIRRTSATTFRLAHWWRLLVWVTLSPTVSAIGLSDTTQCRPTNGERL